MKDRIYNLFIVLGEYALYGLLFFLPISNALIESFAGLALFSFVGRKIIKPDFRFLKFWPNIILYVFLLFSALSLFNSGAYLVKSLNALFGKWMQYLGICLIFQDAIYDEKVFKRGIWVFLSSAILIILSGLSQYFFGLEFLRNRSIYELSGGTHPITSSFVHYNSFGGYLVVVLALTVALLLANNNFGVKAFGLLALTMFSTLAIVFTFSRGSLLAFAISFIFICIFAKRHLKWLIPVILIGIVIFLFPAFHERLLFTFKTYGDANRFKYWVVAMKMIGEHPFLGMGVGTFMANFSKFQPYLAPAYAHNCYLQIWAETGIFSLISFLAFAASVIYLGIKKFVISKDYVLLGLLAGVIGFLIHSLFDVNLYSLQLVILFWVWVGLTLRRLKA